MQPKCRYITTTLPYVNAEPHVGFALEAVQADTLARYWRLLDHDVFFNTGTDEHGQKIAQKADEQGKGRQQYVDEYAATFTRLRESLNLSYTAFIRTTDAKHKAAAQAIWQRCAAKGDVYKKSYKGHYCVGCELFYRESELEAGLVCPIHKKPTEEVEEENYFFKLSNYEVRLLEQLSDPASVVPDWQRQWAIDFVKGGLEDLSISRQRSRMDWGIPVPGDDDHVMYVWFDALTNYISTLGWPDESPNSDFTKYWVEGDTLQLAGKDQVRFQSIIWQAMLMSADIPTTKQIFYHGFINSGGQKMSKSLGNVISPYDMVARYGTDATRYILLRHVHPTDDSDITWEKMDEWYTANLVNGLGNLTARIMKMAETHVQDIAIHPPTLKFEKTYEDAMSRYDFMVVCDFVWSYVQKLDERITTTEPFKLVKTDTVAAEKIIIELTHGLYHVAELLRPIMPGTSERIFTAVLTNKKPDNLFPRLESIS
jgi:methionyl-tRNA synthetase